MRAWCHFRSQNANWVRVEGDRNTLRSEFAGTIACVLDNPAMAAVDAIEIADSNDRRAIVGWNLIEGAEDLHGYSSKEMRRPS